MKKKFIYLAIFMGSLVWIGVSGIVKADTIQVPLSVQDQNNHIRIDSRDAVSKVGGGTGNFSFFNENGQKLCVVITSDDPNGFQWTTGWFDNSTPSNLESAKPGRMDINIPTSTIAGHKLEIVFIWYGSTNSALLSAVPADYEMHVAMTFIK